MRKFIMLQLLLHFLVSFMASSQSLRDKELIAKVNEYMKTEVAVNHFSGTVLIAQEGRPIISNGFGMANYEWNIPNTPQTKFRLGSITKSFTATAIMILKELGKLKLDDKVFNYLDDCPPIWKDVTIRQLLIHSSGITEFTALPDFRQTMALPMTHKEFIDRIKDKPLDFQPGQGSAYSNSGYYILGLIIESVSKIPFDIFINDHICKPLGMHNTGYDSNNIVISNRAAGYLFYDNKWFNASYIDMSIPYAAGAMYSTAEDLLLFDQAFYTEALLKKTSIKEMFTPYSKQYGLGWDILEENNRQKIEKRGLINGFSTALSRFPEEMVSIIVLGNNATLNTQSVVQGITSIVFDERYKISKEKKPIILSHKELVKYAGIYHPESGPDITITLENGKLMRQVGLRLKEQLHARSGDIFIIEGADIEFSFIKSADGKVTGHVIHRNGREFIAYKVK